MQVGEICLADPILNGRTVFSSAGIFFSLPLRSVRPESALRQRRPGRLAAVIGDGVRPADHDQDGSNVLP
jgi:hypothetical protein